MVFIVLIFYLNEVLMNLLYVSLGFLGKSICIKRCIIFWAVFLNLVNGFIFWKVVVLYKV